MFKNNRNSSGSLWSAILGTSIGIIVGSQITPMKKRKMMRSAKKIGSTLKDKIE